MKLIVGLGNPGKEYANTYHNLGFDVLDLLAKKLGVSINKSKGNALYTQTKVKDEIVFLIKFLSFSDSIENLNFSSITGGSGNSPATTP